jgi:glycerophosphoryl diester phosphodiesterase
MTNLWLALLLLLVAGGASAHAENTAPLIVAHRGGLAEAPENTLQAIRHALAAHADMIWLTVQLSKDGVPVLYHADDLSAMTNGHGPVSALTLAALQQLDAGFAFREMTGGETRFPDRGKGITIPTLEAALAAIPRKVPIILDMKALPAAPQARAVAVVLDRLDAWGRVHIYSTSADYQAAFAAYPKAVTFEARDMTRQRLLGVALSGRCLPPPPRGQWVAYEMQVPLTVTEHFTLGEGQTTLTARLWTTAAMRCFESRGSVPVLGIGVNDAADLTAAACLGMTAVLANGPRQMATLRATMPKPPAGCPS